MIRHPFHAVALWLALAGQGFLPFAQWLHESTTGCPGCAAVCIATIPPSVRVVAQTGELLFDLPQSPRPQVAPSLRSALLALNRARNPSRPLRAPAHDSTNCLICLQLAQCRAADKPALPIALPAPAPVIAALPLPALPPTCVAALPLPPARAPPAYL